MCSCERDYRFIWAIQKAELFSGLTFGVIQKWDCPLDWKYAAPIARQKQNDEVGQGMKPFNKRSHNEQTFSPLDDPRL
jgi:hypothetical protein